MAAVVGAFTFSSCNNNDDPNPGPVDLGEEVDVAIGVQLASRPGGPALKAASTADDLNFGSTLKTIDNIVIVPYVGSNAASNIVFGTFNPATIGGDNNTKCVDASIPQATNMFRVYGNVAGDFASAKGVTIPDLDNSSYAASIPDGSVLTDVYPAHPLYYYVEAVGANNDDTGFKVGVGAAANDVYSKATNNPTDGTVGTNNRVVITKPLRYGVGALAAAVLDGVKDGENAADSIFFMGTVDSDSVAVAADSYLAWKDFAQKDSIVVTGIVIEKQAKGFNADFTPKADVVSVYAGAADSVLVSDKLSYGAGGAISNTGNIYSVVAPTTETSIVVNFQFRNNTSRYFVLNSEDSEVSSTGKYGLANVVAPGDYFYLATTLNRDNNGNRDIFAAFTSTLLNATVNDWGKASQSPVQTVDVELGITVETDWAEGIVYDVEL